MGEFQLQFMWVNPNRTTYRYANQQHLHRIQKRAWTPFLPQLGTAQFVCVLTTFKESSRSKSKSTYNVLGVLCSFDTLQELQLAGNLYWRHTQFLEDNQKPERIIELAQCFKQYVGNDEWNNNTEEILGLCAEGELDMAREAALLIARN